MNLPNKLTMGRIFAIPVFIIVFLIVVEFVRDRLAHEIALDDLSDVELRELFQARDGVSDSPAPQPVELKGGLK